MVRWLVALARVTRLDIASDVARHLGPKVVPLHTGQRLLFAEMSGHGRIVMVVEDLSTQLPVRRNAQARLAASHLIQEPILRQLEALGDLVHLRLASSPSPLENALHSCEEGIVLVPCPDLVEDIVAGLCRRDQVDLFGGGGRAS